MKSLILNFFFKIGRRNFSEKYCPGGSTPDEQRGEKSVGIRVPNPGIFGLGNPSVFELEIPYS